MSTDASGGGGQFLALAVRVGLASQKRMNKDAHSAGKRHELTRLEDRNIHLRAQLETQSLVERYSSMIALPGM